MQGILIIWVIIGIWILIGITAMQFTFRIDWKEIKTASFIRRLFWYYGVFFASLIILTVLSSFVFYMTITLLKG